MKTPLMVLQLKEKNNKKLAENYMRKLSKINLLEIVKKIEVKE